MALVNKIISPTGFLLDNSQGIFYSKTDAWQHNVGYFALYDKAAPFAGMIIQCEPIKFEYDNRKWNIELWKGQYGAFTGAEIGIYTGTFKVNDSTIDRGLERLELGGDTQCASAEDWLQMSFVLKTKNGAVFFRRNSDNPDTGNLEKHWWLTGFKLGLHSPNDLINEVTIHFKDVLMLDAFVGGLKALGYTDDKFSTNGNTIIVNFSNPLSPQPASWALNSYEAIYSSIVPYIRRVFNDTQLVLSEVGEYLRRYFSLNTNFIAKILKDLGFSYNEIATYLKEVLNLTLEEIGSALKFANASKRQLGNALKHLGYSFRRIANFLKDSFGLSNKKLAELLKELGYSAKTVANYFKDESTEELIKILNFAGYAKDKIIDAIASVLNIAVGILRAIWNRLF